MKNGMTAALAAGLVICLAVARLAAAEALNTLTPEEEKAGWKLLFDGKTTKGWRNYKSKDIRGHWQVKDGALARAGSAGDIVTQDQYDNFELSIDYKISKGGNSGIMFHVSEDAAAPFMTGPEVQIIDNKKNSDPQKAGWLYQLYKQDCDATRPAGEWNNVRLILTPEKSEVWLNGMKYYEFVKGSADWNERVKASKFASMPGFGKASNGHICLQDHGDEVAFRNIKIRPIPAK